MTRLAMDHSHFCLLDFDLSRCDSFMSMKDANSLVIGSRGSPLALAQAHWVQAQLQRKFPSLKLSIAKIRTSGDIRTDHPLDEQGRKGLYTREIEVELAEQNVDVAVHSMKDLPTELAPQFALAAITTREDARDVFISEKYSGLLSLPRGSRLGTASLRRSSQLRNFRPDFTVQPIRGNVETRLKKLNSENLDGIILAAAGLKRLGLAEHITEYLAPSMMMPAAGQGALGIEVRADDQETLNCVSFLNDPNSSVAVRAERACVQRLSGGCETPITAYAEVNWNRIELVGLVATPDGRELIRDQTEGDIRDPEAAGLKLAETLLGRGAQRLIDQIHSHAKKR